MNAREVIAEALDKIVYPVTHPPSTPEGKRQRADAILAALSDAYGSDALLNLGTGEVVRVNDLTASWQGPVVPGGRVRVVQWAAVGDTRAKCVACDGEGWALGSTVGATYKCVVCDGSGHSGITEDDK